MTYPTPTGGYDIRVSSQLAFSPDGKLLANLVGNQLMLWDITTGNALPLAESSRFFFVNSIADMTFSPDGTLLVWSDTSGAVYGWNIAAQKTEFVIREGNSWALAFSPDGKTLAAGGCTQIDEERHCTQGGLWFWNVETQELRYTLEVPDGRSMSGLVYSPDGLRLAAEGSDNRIVVFDAETGDLQQSFATQDGNFLSLAINPEGTRLAAARSDDSYSPYGGSAVYVWDTATGDLQQVIEGTGRVQSVAFSADEKLLASADFRGVVRLWDIQSGSVIKQFETEQSITSVFFTLDGQSLLVYGDKFNMSQWDIESGQLQQERDDIRVLRQNSQLSPSGVIAISPESDTIDRIWDPISGTTLMTLSVDPDPLDHYPYYISYVLSPDGTTVAKTNDNYNVIHLQDATTGVSKIILDGHTDRPRSLRFSTDGSYLLSSGDDGTLRWWDTHTGTMLRVISYFDAESGLTFTLGANDTLVATGDSFYGGVQLYSVETGERLSASHAQNHGVNRIVFSPKNTYMALAVDDGTVRLWGIP